MVAGATGLRLRRALVVAGLTATGTVVLIAPAGAVDVATDAELRAAWGDPATAEITLTTDVDLACTGSVTRSSATPLALDGAGHTLTNECPQLGLQNSGLGMITLRDVTYTGAPGSGQGVGTVGVVALEGTTIAGHGGAGVGSFLGVAATGSVVIDNGGNGLGSSDIAVTNTTISGNAAQGVSAAATVVAAGSTISGNGDVGIDADDAVAVSDSIVADNGGGGIETSDTVTIENTLVDANGATGVVTSDAATLAETTVSGHGIVGVITAALLDVTHSTITANNTGLGTFSDLAIRNSTVTANTATGITADSATVVYSTVVANGGNAVDANTVEMFATVLDDSGATNCAVGTMMTSAGDNWADDDSCGLTGPGDAEDPGGDPGLGALADNGGPTQTQLPATTSPLIDRVALDACQTGPATGVTTDQRGEARPGAFTDGCDTGAVEVQGSEPVVPTTTTPGPTTLAPTSPSGGADSLPRTGTTGQRPLAVVGGLLVAVGLAVTARRRVGRAR